MSAFLDFIQFNKPYFDAAHALSSIVNLIGWLVGAVLLTVAWRRKAISTVSVGSIAFQMQMEAVTAAAAAARDWDPGAPGKRINVTQIRETVSRAFEPEVAEKIAGRSILWVDDRPANNELVVRTLKRLQLIVEQVTSTELAVEALANHKYDLIISDMGRGTNMRAGYELLEIIRAKGLKAPFLIFAGSDSPEFRREAAERGAQLSTNNMLELIQAIISHLSD